MDIAWNIISALIGGVFTLIGGYFSHKLQTSKEAKRNRIIVYNYLDMTASTLYAYCYENTKPFCLQMLSFDKNMWSVLAASDVSKKEYADIANWFFCITLISTEYNNIVESEKYKKMTPIEKEKYLITHVKISIAALATLKRIREIVKESDLIITNLK